MHAFGLRCAGRRFVGADSCSCAENKALTLHEDPKLGVFVKGSVEQIVGSLADVLRLVQKGEQKRKTGSDRACVPIAALTFPRTASRLLTATAGRSTEQMKNSHAILSLILEFRNVRAKRRGLRAALLLASDRLQAALSSTRTPCACLLAGSGRWCRRALAPPCPRQRVPEGAVIDPSGPARSTGTRVVQFVCRSSWSLILGPPSRCVR